MSEHIAAAIQSLEQEIASLDRRRGELLKAIDTMQPLMKPLVFGGQAIAAPAKRGRPAKGRKPERLKRATRVPRAARTSLSTEDTGAAILKALHATSPQRPSELAKALGLRMPTLRYHLMPLEQSGQVVITGTTMSRRIALAEKGNGSEVAGQRSQVAGPRPEVQKRTGNGSADPVVEQRDAALLRRMKAGPQSLHDLHSAVPGDTEDALRRALVRLKVKGQVKPAAGDKWALA